jgi:Spy/CpxP family protein refolding chaperone
MFQEMHIMKAVLRSVLVMAIVGVVLANIASAQDEKKKGRGQRNAGGAMDPFRLPRSITLSDEQKKQLDDLKKEYEPKRAAASKKAELTSEQRNAARQAAEGKRGKEAREAFDAAANLTAEQKEARAELRKINGEIRQKIEGFLTDDQKKALQDRRKQGRKKSDA